MDRETRQAPVSKVLAAGAIAVGLAAGSYGVASAASGSGSASTSGSATPATTTPSGQPAAAPSGSSQSPWGVQRSDETLLTGETAAKVTQLAEAKEPNATLVRVETDADGHAAYEAHMVKADGTPVTVYVDKSFAVVSVETR
jgi:hypothetical protein